MTSYRTHNLAELRISDVNKTVTLSGWVDTKRDLGGLTFIDLRDREGKTQIVFHIDYANESIIENAQNLKNESVIKISGIVKERESKNTSIPTGEIEVFVNDLEILNNAKVLPFQISTNENIGENIRLKYRYLDIRRTQMIKILN